MHRSLMSSIFYFAHHWIYSEVSCLEDLLKIFRDLCVIRLFHLSICCALWRLFHFDKKKIEMGFLAFVLLLLETNYH